MKKEDVRRGAGRKEAWKRAREPGARDSRLSGQFASIKPSAGGAWPSRRLPYPEDAFRKRARSRRRDGKPAIFTSQPSRGWQRSSSAVLADGTIPFASYVIARRQLLFV